jgi:L-ribulose-5-phosphate 3-epimerase
MYLLGYNTNGFAHHDPLDAVEVLAEIGYGSIAVTLDHHCLNPFAPDLESRLTDYLRALQRYSLRSVVETGARFLLDPRIKHEPTLVSPFSERREQRIDFLRRAIDIAAELGSDCVSFWSGIVRDDSSDEVAWERLTSALTPVLDYADQRSVQIGFEPEPGMFIDTMRKFDELRERLGSPPHFQLTLDIGHLHCQGETPLASYIQRYRDLLINVHLEDMRAGVHEHLMFGEGEIDFGEVLGALRDASYPGGVHVELSRHSHDAPATARRAFEFLSR